MEQVKDITDKVNRVLSEEFEVDPGLIVPGANLRQVLSLDSLDYVDLGALIEKNFFFKVKQEDFVNIITFQDLHEYIISHVQETGDGRPETET
jgi:acyl carrier protein